MALGLPLVVFWGCKAPSTPAESTPGAASPASDAGAAETGEAVETTAGDASDEATPPPPPARTAESGLDPGMKLRPFDAVDIANDERYCPVCRFADGPMIIAVGAPDDPEFGEDLADLEAVLARHRPYGARPEDDPVHVFALVGRFGEGGLAMPSDARQAIIDSAAQLRRRLGLRMPVLVPANDPATSTDGAERTLADHYRFRRGRTLMLVDAEGVVQWSAVAPPHLAQLDAKLAPLMAPGRDRHGKD